MKNHFRDMLTLAPVRFFFTASNVSEGVRRTPPAVRPLMELELRGKNECVTRNERKPMALNFKKSGQLMTSEVRSNSCNSCA